MTDALLIMPDIDTSTYFEAMTLTVSPMGMRTCVSGSQDARVESCFPSQGFPTECRMLCDRWSRTRPVEKTTR